MPATEIKDGLITTLSAASAFGENGVSTNYSVLEGSAGSCLVISWLNVGSGKTTFGPSQIERLWTFSVEIFLQDQGDHVKLMNKPFEAIDTIIATLESDPTVQGTATDVSRISAFHRPSAFRELVEAGGITWLMFNIEVDVKEFLA